MGLAFGYAGLMTNEGVNVSLLFGAVSFIVGAIGGLVWIFSAEKAAQGAAPIEVPEATLGRMNISGSIPALFAIPAAAMVSAALIWAIRPLLLRHALARPNARSSHRIPTPQGAGIAVIAATLVVAGGIVVWGGAAELNIPLAVFGAALFMAMVGFADDVKSIDVLPRLLLQAAAVAAILLRGIRRSADRSGLPAMDRARHPAAGRALVRQSRQLHGRAGLDDGGRGGADHGGAGRCSACSANFPPRQPLSLRRSAARCSDLRRSTARSPGSFSATSAACRSACCSAGACCSSPIGSNSPPPCCCRCIICSTPP